MSKNPKFYAKISEIDDDHNFGTKYARNMKFVSKCAVLDTLPYSTNIQFRPKVDLGPFGNELFRYIIPQNERNIVIKFRNGTMKLTIAKANKQTNKIYLFDPVTDPPPPNTKIVGCFFTFICLRPTSSLTS